MIYTNADVRDRVVRLAIKHNIYPNELESEGVAIFITNEDEEIVDVEEK